MKASIIPVSLASALTFTFGLTATGVAQQSPQKVEKVEIVRVVGCLQREGADWLLREATDPVANAPQPARKAEATPAAEPAATPVPAAGRNEYKLIGVSVFNLPGRENQRVAVTGLLIEATPVSTINITTVGAIASSCGADAVPVQTTQKQPPKSDASQAQLPKSQLPDLGRPTSKTDPLPLFDFERYFLGRWSFEWEVPESPLGPAGTIAGTTAYTKLADDFYEANTEATGPTGPIEIKETFAYARDNKTLARSVTDSRGFSYIQIATIGGDLGGYYTLYFDSAPFVFNGQSVRLRTTMQLLSPVNYKVESRISVDGGPAANLGNTWWERQNGAGAPGNKEP